MPKILIAAFVFTMSCLCANPLFAERVRKVYADGSVEFETGLRVQIAGVQMAPEAIKILPILLADQEVQVEEIPLKHLPLGVGESNLAYLYIRTNEIIYESNSLQKSAEKKQMVNEMLLEMGAAKVYRESVPENMRDDFLKIEELARSSGAGIWSYNVSSKTSAVN